MSAVCHGVVGAGFGIAAVIIVAVVVDGGVAVAVGVRSSGSSVSSLGDTLEAGRLAGVPRSY